MTFGPEKPPMPFDLAIEENPKKKTPEGAMEMEWTPTQVKATAAMTYTALWFAWKLGWGGDVAEEDEEYVEKKGVTKFFFKKAIDTYKMIDEAHKVFEGGISDEDKDKKGKGSKLENLFSGLADKILGDDKKENLRQAV